jgi:hypothetical protein
VSLTTPSGRVAQQGYLAPLDHGAGSSCRSLYALALMFPPKLSSHCTARAACRMVEADERARPTPTAHGDMLALRFPRTYRRHWRPLRPADNSSTR